MNATDLRRMIAVVTLAVTPVALVACSSEDDPETPDPTTATSSTTSGVPLTSTSVPTPTSAAGAEGGMGSIPEQPGGTAQPQGPDTSAGS